MNHGEWAIWEMTQHEWEWRYYYYFNPVFIPDINRNRVVKEFEFET